MEAGLSSYDRGGVIGVLADLYWAPTGQALRNLRAEGVTASTIYRPENTDGSATAPGHPG